MSNSIMVIAPYYYEGTWVFDDPAAGLVREPFVCGIPEMIDYWVREIQNAKQGFRLTFSSMPFPGSQIKLKWLREEIEGNWYACDEPSGEGWLCPALFKYFDSAPQAIFARVDPR